MAAAVKRCQTYPGGRTGPVWLGDGDGLGLGEDVGLVLPELADGVELGLPD
jgi:hypothetical protein